VFVRFRGRGSSSERRANSFGKRRPLAQLVHQKRRERMRPYGRDRCRFFRRLPGLSKGREKATQESSLRPLNLILAFPRRRRSFLPPCAQHGVISTVKNNTLPPQSKLPARPHLSSEPPRLRRSLTVARSSPSYRPRLPSLLFSSRRRR
jgi:hypothetical protein